MLDSVCQGKIKVNSFITRLRTEFVGGAKMANKDSKGRFVAGNKAAVGRKTGKQKLREQFLDFLPEIPPMLRLMAHDIDQDIQAPENDNWRKFCLMKIRDGDKDFVKWVFEMALGKPSQNVEMQSDDNEKLKEEIYILRDQLSKKHEKEY